VQAIQEIVAESFVSAIKSACSIPAVKPRLHPSVPKKSASITVTTSNWPPAEQPHQFNPHSQPA
jgi:hypothetical protein